MKLWSGRLTDDDERLDAFNRSISVDSRMFEEDIAGSVAHAAMLGKTGIISPTDADAIIAGLGGILTDVKSGALEVDPQAEDVHTFVELTLTERIGAPGKMLHTARSRNDQVALDARLYARRRADELVGEIGTLLYALTDLAERHVDTIMPGYTHLQRAQPVTFAHHLAAYCQMLLRDRARFLDARARLNYSPLGAGALAGTTHPIDRQMTASALNFTAPCENSMDAVADRDFALELCADCAILMVHLSRLCEELVLWTSYEFRFITLADAFSTGSSIMPQKKNPDLPELVRGKSARVIGDLTTLLSLMKNLPLAYNKDMQEDKEALFDAFDTASACLCVMAPMFATLTVHADRMRAAAAEGFINATDCADYLVRKGVPFREAYAVCGKLVRLCLERNLTLETLPLAEYRDACPAFDSDIYDAVSLDNCLSRRDVDGGPAPVAVRKQLAAIRAALAQ